MAATVSAVMPAFNSAAFISRAIDSVLAQKGRHLLELIIVDDCSSDGTSEFIRSRYGGDQHVVLLSTERNSGPGLARNLALAGARGEWIGLIDADDAWAPDRLMQLLSGGHRTGADLIFDNLLGYDQQAAVQTGPLFPAMPEQMSLLEMVAEQAPGSKFNYGYLKPLIRTSFLKRTGLLYPDARISEDLLFYLGLLAFGARSRTSARPYYFYTTPIGQRSGRRSSASSSVPDEVSVAAMLDDFVSSYGDRLNVREIEAISRRAARLRESVPLNRLYESWTGRRYFDFAWTCLADADARRALFHKLRNRRKLERDIA